MAYVAGRIIQKVAGPALGYAVSRGVRAFKKYDVQIHRNLYGRSGGRGVRHGRDAGSIIAGLYQGTRRGDDLDGKEFQPKYSSRPKSKARRGRSNQYRFSGAKCRPYYRSKY